MSVQAISRHLAGLAKHKDMSGFITPKEIAALWLSDPSGGQGQTTTSVMREMVKDSGIMEGVYEIVSSKSTSTRVEEKRVLYVLTQKKEENREVVMTIERGGGARSTSPVHVHVDDATPVHVHVKKPGYKSTKSIEVNTECDRVGDAKSKSSFGASNLRRSTATARSRSKSPTGPWVPPPGKTTKGSKYTWQSLTNRWELEPVYTKYGYWDGEAMLSSSPKISRRKGASHRLEIGSSHQGAVVGQGSLHRSDLSTDEEEANTQAMRKYEKKIDALMSEVGTLKNEVELQRTIKDLERKEDELETSRRVLEHQGKELEEYRRELDDTEAENRLLRRSHDRVSLRRSGEWGQDREQLMKKLVEVEMDGQAAAKQAAALKDMTRRLSEEKRPNSSDTTMLNKSKELLLDRIADFETSNRMLRKMLRDRHEQEADNLCLAEQRDLLLKKLSETEDNLLRVRSGILDKDRTLSDFRVQAEAQKEENMALSNLQASLENTRAHLQKQLRQKEGDCNRLAVQVRTLESQLAQEKIEVDHLSGLLGQAKEKSDRDKEALKKATRVQKQRAARSEDALEQMNAQLLERDTQLAEFRAEIDNSRSHIEKLSKEKSQMHAENIALKTRMTELENIMMSVEDNSKSQVETVTARLHNKTSEASALKLENERLKTSLVTIEDKLTQADSEVSQLRGNLRQYETLIDEYRNQHSAQGQTSSPSASYARSVMNKSRREADETMTMLDHQKAETKRLGQESEVELEKVKCRLQNRLAELEPIPELLKSTELRLQDVNEKAASYERRNTENTKLIAELTAKVESQADQIGHLHEKLHLAQDDGRTTHTRYESTERKLRELEEQNRELLKTVAKREESIHQANMRLDEKSRENASLNRQLEGLLGDARRVNENARDKAAAKDRTTQSRILDLEAQLSQSRAEIARIKREKDEAERKFNSRLYDVKDRLEQAHSTNRSMQNYVQFLKNSYANVFGDQTVTASSPLRSTFY